MTKQKKYYIWFAPAVSLVILLILYAVKGIYPFGSGNMLGGDLYQQYIPNMLNFFDSVHSGTWFYDFTTAGGFDREQIMNLFAPTNWFVLLSRRDALKDTISILLIIKLVLIALSASYSFSKLFEDLSPKWIVLSSLLYTFSGYNIQYFTNIYWLDTVALFPLLIVGLNNVFKGKSKLLYIFLLSYFLTFETYMAFFIVVSLIVFGGLYVYTVIDKEDRKTCVSNLGIATLIPIICCAYPVYSYFTGVASSQRFTEIGSGSNSTDFLTGVLTRVAIGLDFDVACVIMFFGCEIAVACLFFMLLIGKQDKNIKKHAAFFSISFLFMFAQAINHGTDILWHGGSRVGFPFRNGFMISFLACLVINYYFSKVDKLFVQNIDKKKFINITGLVLSVVAFGLAASFLGDFKDMFSVYNPAVGDEHQSDYFYAMAMLVILITLAYFGFALTGKKIRQNLIICTAIVLLCVNTYSFIGNASDSDEAKNYNKYYRDCYTVGEMLRGNDRFQRVSDPALSLITNYAYISGVNSISNWTATISGECSKSFKELGYSAVFTRVLDSGGTAFSDALMRITDTVSDKQLNDSLYTKREEKNGIISYKNRFVLPFGVLADDSITKLSYDDYDNTFEYQNALFNSLGGKGKLFTKLLPKTTDSKIIKKKKYYSAHKNVLEKVPDKDIKAEKCEINTNDNSVVYMCVNKKHLDIKTNKMYLYRLAVNGENLVISDYAESENHLTNLFYPQGFNNNVVELGSFDKGTAELEYDIMGGKFDDIEIYSMDITKLRDFCNKKENAYSSSGDSFDVNVSCDSDGYAFIPVSYSDNWACTVNGKIVKPEVALGNFMAVKVSAGKNEIDFSYSKAHSVKKAVIIAAGLLLCIILALAQRKIRKIPNWLSTVFSFSFLLLTSVATFVIYVFPAIVLFFK